MSGTVGYRAYASEDVVTGEGVSVELPVATLPQRLGGALIDWIIYLTVFIGVLIGTLLLDFSSQAVVTTVLILTVVTCLVIIPATVEYVTGGRSVGKLALGLRVVRDDGGRITARHCLTRALVGFVEVFFPILPGGVIPIVMGLVSLRSKRIGDMAAGTFAINERVKLRLLPAPPMPPPLGEWAMHADIATFPPSLAIAVRQFLGRSNQLAPQVRDRVGRELYVAAMKHVSPPPPPMIHHEHVLAAILADRRRRDAQRLAREDARRARLVPHDPLM